MQSEQTMIPATIFPAVRSDGEIGYPTNRLISVFDDWTSLNLAVITLADAGVDLNAIEVLRGAEGLRRLGPGQASGRLAGWLERQLPELGPERELLHDYRDELHKGHLLIVVRHPRPLPHAIIQQSLTVNGGHATHFFGRFAVHTLST
jgi:hypothetical protein